MKIGRKQLVLASMILALGAAVYLNWQFAGTGQLPLEEEEDASSQLGAAQLVNNAYVETVNDTVEEDGGQSSQEDVLSQVRLDRQNARDQATELLDQVLEGVESDPQAKQTAVEEASALAQNILRETNVENLLAAKGYEDSVAAISGRSALWWWRGSSPAPTCSSSRRRWWSKPALPRIKSRSLAQSSCFAGNLWYNSFIATGGPRRSLKIAGTLGKKQARRTFAAGFFPFAALLEREEVRE